MAPSPNSSRQSSVISNPDLAYCVVWSPLPPITWLLPFIGHLGICDSRGVVNDFRGPYYVGDDGRMAFGAPTRAFRIPGVGDDDPETSSLSDNNGPPVRISAAEWDDAIQHANEEYKGRMHNICCDNCHSHVAYALNHINVHAFGVYKWDMVKLAFLSFVKGRFLTWAAVLRQFGPFVIFVIIIHYVKK